jgi:hypothetical protein
MKMGVYVIYDRIAEEAGPLFTAKSDSVAIRNYRISLKEVQASEYRLYAIGEYDNEKVLLYADPKHREVNTEVSDA